MIEERPAAEHGALKTHMIMQDIDVEMLIWELGNAQAELVSMSENVKRTHSYLCERRNLTRWTQSDVCQNGERFEKERKIWAHYDHAREKHPHFCDTLLPPVMKRFPDFWDDLLKGNRGELNQYYLGGCVPAKTVLKCELSEMEAAIAHDDTTAAVEEAYDCIAVLLRVIDVLEGRQKLGQPEEDK